MQLPHAYLIAAFGGNIPALTYVHIEQLLWEP